MTFNVFTVAKILDFIKFFSDEEKVKFCYNYVNQKFLRISVLDDRFTRELIELEEYIIDRQIGNKFESHFYKDLKSLILNDELHADKFRSAITNSDAIRNTNWRNIFPEYIDWFDKK